MNKEYLLSGGCFLAGLIVALGLNYWLHPADDLAKLKMELADKSVECIKVAHDSKAIRDQVGKVESEKQQLKTQNIDLEAKLSTFTTQAAGVEAAKKNAQEYNRLQGKGQWVQQQMMAFKTRLNLNPEQIAQMQKTIEINSNVYGFFRPWEMVQQTALDQEIAALLPKEQNDTYQKIQREQRQANMETLATSEANRLKVVLDLNEEQKNQAYAALCRIYQETFPVETTPQAPSATPDAAGKKKKPPESVVLAWQTQHRTDEFSKILTPAQMEIYKKQMTALLP